LVLKIALVENLYKFKGFGIEKVIREFLDKGWNVRSLKRHMKKLRDSDSTTRRTGGGRRRSVRSDENIDAVSDLVKRVQQKYTAQHGRLSKKQILLLLNSYLM